MDIDTENFPKILFEIARDEPKIHVRAIIRTYANNLDFLIKAFSQVPSSENLRELNGMWASAFKALSMVTPKVPPNDGVDGRLTMEKAA